jgi:hypothetical protein
MEGRDPDTLDLKWMIYHSVELHGAFGKNLSKVVIRFAFGSLNAHDSLRNPFHTDSGSHLP